MRLKTALTPEYLAGILGLRLRAKAVLEGALAGWHRSPFHGYSSEFSQYKSYTPGDDVKRLDWRVYGRRDQAVLRQYRDETNAIVYLAVDTSASMGYGSGFTKLETAAVLAASLALLAERQRDAISLAWGEGEMRAFLPPENGHLRTREILGRLEELRAEGKTDLEHLCSELAPRIAGRGFVFLFTDLWQEPKAVGAGLRRLRHKTQSAAVVRLRTPEEEEFLASGAYRLRDLETGEEAEVSAPQARGPYLAAVKEHAAALAGECARLGVRLVPVSTAWPLDAALRKIVGGG